MKSLKILIYLSNGVSMGFMTKMMTEQEAEQAVADILERGVGAFVDPDDTFRKKLIAKAQGKYKKEIIIKFGVDPTRPDIHLGHAVVLRKLRQLQDLGCKVIFLAGDFTAMIGDPTGKSKSRPEIDQRAMSANMQSYVSQIPKILKIDPNDEDKEKEKNKIITISRDQNGFVVDSPWFSWMRNAEWFEGVTDISTEGASKQALTFSIEGGSPVVFPDNSFPAKATLFQNTRLQNTYFGKKQIYGVTFINIMSILRKISFSQLIERDMFQDRIKQGEPLFMHEMLYPVIQGIDSDVLANIYGSCDLEVGGTDQTFNMLMGRKVMEMTKKETVQAVLSFALLVGLDGKEKMSKSLDNYVGITDAPNDMFGKIMSVPDAALASYLELCTFTPMSAVETITKDLKSGKLHPKEVKMDLAQQVVEIYHGRDVGVSARQHFVDTFQNKELPKDMLEVRVEVDTLLADVLITEKLVASKSEFRRLLDEGAIRIDGETKITDPFTKLTEEMVLKIGKHRFLKISVTPKK
jgi:tyrosyl-tRNA synthetase